MSAWVLPLTASASLFAVVTLNALNARCGNEAEQDRFAVERVMARQARRARAAREEILTERVLYS